MFRRGQEVWVMHKKKPTKWTVFEPDYDFLGNKFIKLKNGKDYILTTWEKIFHSQEVSLNLHYA